MLSQALQVRHIIQKKWKFLRSKIAPSFLSLLSWSVVSHCSLQNRHAQWVIFHDKRSPLQLLKNSQELPTCFPDRYRTHRRCTLTVDFKFSVPGLHHIIMNGVAIQTVTGEDWEKRGLSLSHVTLNWVSHSQKRRNVVLSLKYSLHPLSIAWYRSCLSSKRLDKVKQKEELLDHRGNVFLPF